ncbi:MAG: carbohydrate kinase [Candidatus Eremiobacteraeota bacterium]|nr:carbohydrate kinase [Candidatus Eremiobacteraeota bacterium]
MSYVLCVGEALVDFVAQSGLADLGASEVFARAAGGAVANVAVGVARLGGHARFAGTVSRDAFGRYLLRTLAHENVGVDDTRIVDALTTLAFVARAHNGERDFMFVRSPGADSQLRSDDLDEDSIVHARALHFGGVLLASEPARSTCLKAARLAREHRVMVTFDPNARRTLFDSDAHMGQLLRGGCAVADLVKLSDEDLIAMGEDPDDAASLLNEMTRAVIITRGVHGAQWYSADGRRGSCTAPAIEAVDTTGAGDAASAAILWRLLWTHRCALDAEALSDAVAYGCAAGALACLREGAIPALPTARELEAMRPQVGTAPLQN